MDSGAEQRELIAILRRGVDCWNTFRSQHPDYIVLNDASFPDAQLAHANLSKTIVMESNLRRANLACASLERAILRKTDLRGSDLRHANIDGADLCRADLSGADLRDASMVRSFLKLADLRGADLSTARGLTDEQIGIAFGDDRTLLPEDIARPATWTQSTAPAREAF
jgi:uncharacterized protein YjbI with pentapeptide repeats